MEMSEREILYRFERSDRDDNYVSIVAQLNGVASYKIEDILRKNGYARLRGKWFKEDDPQIKSEEADPKPGTSVDRRPKHPSQQTKDLVVNLVKTGFTYRQVSKEVGLSTYTIHRIIKEANSTTSESNIQSKSESSNEEGGALSNRSKITEDAVTDILKMQSEGLSYSVIAKKFGVSKQTIYNVIRKSRCSQSPEDDSIGEANEVNEIILKTILPPLDSEIEKLEIKVQCLKESREKLIHIFS